MNQELFQKYINGRCNQPEKAEVEKWMHTCSTDELDELFMALWNEQQNPAMPSSQTADLWGRIAQQVADQYTDTKVRRLFSYKKWAIAAALLAGILLTTIWIVTAPPANHTIAVQPVIKPFTATTTEWVTVTNTDSNKQLIQLEDGSEVSLFPHATLQYPSSFAADKRSIYLTGKGIFHVAKDKQRPFTVYSGDIATTALGTRFLVDADRPDAYINVQLYEGKVVIRRSGKSESEKEIFLLPGDEYTCNKIKNEVAVGKYTKGIAKPQLAEGEFVNAELATVFDAIENKYKVTIEYNKADTKGLYFTGNISKTGSLSKMLHVIVQMNGLSVTEENGKYSIQKDKE